MQSSSLPVSLGATRNDLRWWWAKNQRSDLERWLVPFLAGLSHQHGAICLQYGAICLQYNAGFIVPGDLKSVQPDGPQPNAGTVIDQLPAGSPSIARCIRTALWSIDHPAGSAQIFEALSGLSGGNNIYSRPRSANARTRCIWTTASSSADE